MLDQFHDLFLQMAPHQFAKIQVTITTLSIHGDEEEMGTTTGVGASGVEASRTQDSSIIYYNESGLSLYVLSNMGSTHWVRMHENVH